MTKLTAAFSAEYKKFFHSKVPLISLLALILVPFIGGFFMIILKDPEMAQRIGLIAAKAHIAGTADWPSYLGLLAQAIAIGGLMVFGFVTSWIFGREYSDRTIKDLLALPISRGVIVFAKFLITFLWCILLALFIFALGMIVGKVIDIPGWSIQVVSFGLSVYVACAVLTILLSTPVAFIASVGRGYISPLGFVVFTLVLAQIVAATGYGQYFPWSVPALASGVAGEESAALGVISFIIVLMTSIAGLTSTAFWWKYADQN